MMRSKFSESEAEEEAEEERSSLYYEIMVSFKA